MLNIADFFKFIVYSFNKRPFPKQDFVIQVHERVLHVLLNLCNEVYVIDKKVFKQFLAYVAPVSEYFSEELFGELLVFQRLSVIHVSWR